jgi:hypothetical protein
MKSARGPERLAVWGLIGSRSKIDVPRVRCSRQSPWSVSCGICPPRRVYQVNRVRNHRPRRG